MNLDINDWKEFKVSSIFTIHNGKGITKDEIEANEGDFIVVQSGEENNGVLGKISKEYCFSMNYTFSEKPCLTVARSGSAGFVSFQINGCVVGDSAKILLLDEKIASIELYVFLQSILSANRFKYAYGRKVTEEKYMNDIIKLPIKHNFDGTPMIDDVQEYSEEGYIPDWKWMGDYIISLHHKPLTTKNKPNNSLSLDVDQWKEFTLNQLFTLKGGFYNKKPEHSIDGKIPFLASTESNNGVTEYYSIEDINQWDKVGNEDYTLDNKIYKGNCITVTVNGSVCNAFYQIDDFACSHDITALYIKHYKMNPYLAEFLCTIIMQDKYRWSYGRKPHDIKKFGKSVLKLPIQCNLDGTPFIDTSKKYSIEGYIPDWKFMENYIKSLPYGDRI